MSGNFDNDPNAKAFSEAFGGRQISPDSARRANEEKGVPVEKAMHCVADYGGCGLSKPANQFFMDIKGLCSACANKISLKYQIPIERVTMATTCRAETQRLLKEAERLAASPEARTAGNLAMLTNGGLAKGHHHFVREMVRGSIECPRDIEFFSALSAKYRKYIYDAFGIPSAEYANKPKNDLLG